MSTMARIGWLRVLQKLGVKNFKAQSGLGLPYICHVGDLAGEAPFYSAKHSAAEIPLMASWCRQIENPVIFDVGANNGFIATQLAQLLRDQKVHIYAFEPVPSTFAQLKLSVERLDLQNSVMPVCCAISDAPGITKMSYNPRESLFAQIRNDSDNARVGASSTPCATVTIDDVVKTLRLRPSLLKIDVEGFEPRVLRGATGLLTGNEPPAICFEWNPLTLSEQNSSPSELMRLLPNYQFYYIDDFEGQRKPFGERISNPSEINWVCNLFATQRTELNESRWTTARSALRPTLDRKYRGSFK
jgi:FkbM family methyltransferase